MSGTECIRDRRRAVLQPRASSQSTAAPRPVPARRASTARHALADAAIPFAGRREVHGRTRYRTESLASSNETRGQAYRFASRPGSLGQPALKSHRHLWARLYAIGVCAFLLASVSWRFLSGASRIRSLV